MGEITKKEDDWLRKATSAAIAEARKIVKSCNGGLMNRPVDQLTDIQWDWIVTAAIFGWIETRVAQSIAEGIDQEEAVRLTASSPSPCDVAVVHSVLPVLADQAAIDWSEPLSAWSKDSMTNFLLLAWRLINKAEARRQRRY
jgi:hypothetical protein